MAAFDAVRPDLIEKEIHDCFESFGHDSLMPPGSANAVADMNHIDIIVHMNRSDTADRLSSILLEDNCS